MRMRSYLARCPLCVPKKMYKTAALLLYNNKKAKKYFLLFTLAPHYRPATARRSVRSHARSGIRLVQPTVAAFCACAYSYVFIYVCVYAYTHNLLFLLFRIILRLIMKIGQILKILQCATTTRATTQRQNKQNTCVYKYVYV